MFLFVSWFIFRGAGCGTRSLQSRFQLFVQHTRSLPTAVFLGMSSARSQRSASSRMLRFVLGYRFSFPDTPASSMRSHTQKDEHVCSLRRRLKTRGPFPGFSLTRPGLASARSSPEAGPEARCLIRRGLRGDVRGRSERGALWTSDRCSTSLGDTACGRGRERGVAFRSNRVSFVFAWATREQLHINEVRVTGLGGPPRRRETYQQRGCIITGMADNRIKRVTRLVKIRRRRLERSRARGSSRSPSRQVRSVSRRLGTGVEPFPPQGSMCPASREAELVCELCSLAQVLGSVGQLECDIRPTSRAFS